RPVEAAGQGGRLQPHHHLGLPRRPGGRPGRRPGRAGAGPLRRRPGGRGVPRRPAAVRLPAGPGPLRHGGRRPRRRLQLRGHGASREDWFSGLAEPAVLLALAAVARETDRLSLSGMHAEASLALWGRAGLSLSLVAAALLVVLLVENCRIPFDDPNTHLELTMIHEVMVLDHSGPAFGMILYSASLKLFIFTAMVVRLAIPLQTGIFLINWILFIVAALGLAALVGMVESIMARLRMVVIPNLLMAAGVLSAFGLVLLLSQP